MTTATMRRVAVSTAIAAGAGALIAAPAASPAQAQLETGRTTLTLNSGTAKALAGLGVSVTPIRPATAAGASVRFPITDGVFNTATTRGRILHSGGLQLRAGSTRVRVTNFDIRIRNKAVIVATLSGGSKIHLANLNLSNARITPVGAANVRVSGVRVTLSGTAARALNRAFGVSALSNTTVLGNAVVNARAYTTALTVDPAAAAALTGLGVTAAPTGPNFSAGGALVFPVSRVSSGGLDRSTLAGRVAHSGGISLTAGGTQVELKNFIIDTTVTPPVLTANVGGTRVPILTLDLSSAATNVSGQTATINGVRGTLTNESAGALNAAFGVSAFTNTLLLGTTNSRVPVK